jgi:putative addiction module component (TIGR02574 family)
MNLAEITRLPLREKLQIMETLWTDLGSGAEDIEVPDEHKTLLDDRLARIESGESKIHNWDDVKDSIGKK